MPSGACVIKRDGVRGVTWSVKYRDADGRQVKESLGQEREGWTRQKAERELGKRLDAVEKGMRKPTRRTFGELLDEFDRVALPAKPRKRTTLIGYRSDIRVHLRPAFGDEDLERLSRSPERFEEYAADKLAAGRSSKSVRNDLGLLGLIFKTARRWRWVTENPLELVELPALDQAETETLTPAEVKRLLEAYRQKADDEPAEAYWWQTARRMTVVALSTGLRRGELLGLRWQDVELLDRVLHVRQAFVLGEMSTPKSRAGRRTIPLGPMAIGALEEQFQASRHRAPESIVFCHEALGRPLDPGKLYGFARAAMKAAAIDKTFRVWHGLRHTCLSETAAAGVPSMFVQAKAGHAQGSTTERYLHASRTAFPDAAELAEARMFIAAD